MQLLEHQRSFNKPATANFENFSLIGKFGMECPFYTTLAIIVVI